MAVENWKDTAEAEYRRGQVYKKQRNKAQKELAELRKSHQELKKAFADLTQENQILRTKIHEETKSHTYTPLD